MFLRVVRRPFHFRHSHHSNLAIMEGIAGVTNKLMAEPKCLLVT
jgi:hypothetical protein